MVQINVHFGVVYLSIAVLILLKPEYRIFESYFGTVIVLFTAATLLKIVYHLHIYPEYFTPLKHIPAPTGRTWLTGNAKSFFIQAPYDEMREWMKTVPNNGLIRYYMVGNLERVLLATPKALSEVLVHKAYDYEKPELVRVQLDRITGVGVLLAEGSEHKKQRKNLLPAFSYRHIKDLYPIFWSKSVELVKTLEEDLNSRNDPKDNVIQASDWASRATLDIVGVAGMDHDFDSIQDPTNEINVQYRHMFTDPSLAMKLVLLFGILLSDLRLVQKSPFKRNRLIQEGSLVVRNVARRMIREKKEKIQNKTSTSTNGVDIISVALESGEFDEEGLADQMMTFLAAGHETTSTALTWAVYALCKHPNVQTRLREEVRANLPPISPENPGSVTATTIDSLPYLNAFCKEVLRFHPSVPVTVRNACRDTTILDIPIPKDTFILIVPEVINKDKEFWGPDADEFNPDRWMGQGRANSGGATNNYSFLTFLHGPRSCIGQAFARGELACLIAALVGRFHMELKDPNAPLEVTLGVTVVPKDGVRARFTPLDGW